MKYTLLSLDSCSFLKQYVFDVYEITTSTEACMYTTVPNGIIGLSLYLKGRSQIFRNGEWEQIPYASIFGLISKPQLIEISPGLREIAIGFRPYFLQMLLSENMSQLTGGRTTDAYDLFNSHELDRLAEVLKDARDESSILSAIKTFVLAHINISRADNRLYTATQLINNLHFNKVEQLSHKLNLSSTSLRNHFREKIGISPKGLIRLSRIRKALHTKIKDDENLTSLSYDLGYFDQAHFIHDFKHIIGLTPNQYFSNNKLTFDFYNFGRWKGDSFDIQK